MFLLTDGKHEKKLNSAKDELIFFIIEMMSFVYYLWHSDHINACWL